MARFRCSFNLLKSSPTFFEMKRMFSEEVQVDMNYADFMYKRNFTVLCFTEA